MSPQEVLLFGMAGGLLPDVIRLVRERHDPTIPPFLKSPKFYLSLALGLLLGGFAAWLLQAGTTKDAVIYGFAAPELMTRLASSGSPAPEEGAFRGETPVPASAAQTSLRSWWAK
jgi:hypothetical protein